MTTLRVLFLGHFVPWPLRGGSLTRSYHLLKEAARVNEVLFLGFTQRELLNTEEKLQDARAEIAKICRTVQVLPIPREMKRFYKHRIVARSVIARSYDEVWLDSKSMRQEVQKQIARFTPDVIHFDTVGLAQYAPLASGCARILNHHNVESHMMRRRAARKRWSLSGRIMSLQARRLRMAERRSALYFYSHLVVSELERMRLEQVISGGRVTVIPNGVDLGYFRPRGSTESVEPASAVFVGGLNWYPNRQAVKWFLDGVWPAIVRVVPHARFRVIGKCDELFRREILTQHRGVEVTGEVDDIRPFVSRSAVYVCPIHDGGGTRLKVLDAMAQGIPLIATQMAVEGLGVQGGDHALLADDSRAFARGVVELFRRPELGTRLAARAYDLVARAYGWENIGRQLRAVYEMAAANGRTMRSY